MLANGVLETGKDNRMCKTKLLKLGATALGVAAPEQANLSLATNDIPFPFPFFFLLKVSHQLSCSHISSSSFKCSLSLAIPSLSGRPKASVILFSRMLLRP